jgi:HAMP domain-containing protein
MRLNIQYLSWLASEAVKKLGLLGLLGLAVALACCLFYVAQLLPQQNKIQDLVSQLQLVNASHNSNQNSHQNSHKDSKQNVEKNNVLAKQVSAADFEKFYANFSESTSLPNTIDVIRENAQKQKLGLPQGDYKLIQTKLARQVSQQVNSQNKPLSNQLAHYEMVLPITGSYQQIRSFIAQVLYQLPALALSDVQIKRENTLNPLVDARLTFVFLLHDNVGQKNATQGSQL